MTVTCRVILESVQPNEAGREHRVGASGRLSVESLITIARPHLGAEEEAAVLEVMRSGTLSHAGIFPHHEEGECVAPVDPLPGNNTLGAPKVKRLNRPEAVTPSHRDEVI